MKTMIVPFRLAGGGVAATSDAVRATEQKIINVLTTGKMERVGLPNYGGGVRELLFENIDELVEADFKMDAAAEITDNVPGLNLVDIRIVQTEDSQANITVYYQLPLSAIGSVTFSVTASLTEESAV